jgi:hypothetical protein
MLAAIALSVIALGVGADDSNSIVVRINGKETRVQLAGVTAGSERGAAFARCLVSGRIVRVKGPHSAATVTLLDDTSVAAHVAEFLQTNTTSDPCAIGKAAYQPKVATPKAAAAQAPAKQTPAKKPARVVHVAFSPGKHTKEQVRVAPPPVTNNEWANTYRPPAKPAMPSDQPTITGPTPAGVYQPTTAVTYTPPVAVTSTGLPQGPPADAALPQRGTQELPQAGTTTIPSTTTTPPR